MSVYRNIDRSEYQFDFLTFRDGKQIFEDEIIGLGGNIYKLPGRGSGLIGYKRALKNFFIEHPEYDRVHYHTSSLSDIEPLIAAYNAKIPVRIVHSHSTNAPGNKIHTILHKLHKNVIHKYATDWYTCSDEAADWMYGGTKIRDKAKYIPNGIDGSRFAFNEESRKAVRDEFHIGDEFLMGLVGRFTPNKNQMFAVDVLAELVKKHPEKNAKLLLVGNGNIFEEVKKHAFDLGIGERVILPGFRNDIPELLSAMDLLLFPSHYEGFGITAIEAQASGLPCLISDTIPKSVGLKDNAFFLSLEDGASVWAEKAAELSGRDLDIQPIIDSGLSVETTVNMLIDRYK